MALARCEVTVRGIVQGVGFRPFVYRLATSLGLYGTVRNRASHVIIELEGNHPALDTFLARLRTEHPPLAQIDEIAMREQPWHGYAGFTITASDAGDATGVTRIAPEIALCPDCAREMLDPTDRRYRYPFITCTNCGPRFSIVTGVPYDRPRTTMRNFPLCPDCAREYDDPLDRRYHAQPIACPKCGPQLALAVADGSRTLAVGDDAMAQACALLRDGAILAIKGLGGYHLACNARNVDAVRELRRRKARDEKPFALMAANITVAERVCVISDREREVLCSPESPIVLMRKQDACDLPGEIAPGNPDLGIMLPYTPLHLLLFQQSDYDLLVMTSGNISGEPVCFHDDDAAEKLAGIADYRLAHNREINTRVDDSVVRVFMERTYPLRRSRGYVPTPIMYPKAYRQSVLACGAQLKNTFCLNSSGQFFLSHHIGDLENYETLQAYQDGIALFRQMFDITPAAMAHDLHPNYLSTQYAISSGLPSIGVQHHRAHIAACMVDNQLDGEVIGVAFDGTGYGDDGQIWGGEFFVGGLRHMQRIGQLEYVGIPGGDSAIAAPWKCALGYLHHAFGQDVPDVMHEVSPEQRAIVNTMLARNFNVFRTSSAGRLFDAAAALIGIRQTISYEGQAAIEMEQACTRQGYEARASYPYELSHRAGVFSVTVGGIIREIVTQLRAGVAREQIALTFHETVAQIILEGCLYARQTTGQRRVALSGGVFQNMWLLHRVHELLTHYGFTVFMHHRVPANDGGLSLGQAAIALERIEE